MKVLSYLEKQQLSSDVWREYTEGIDDRFEDFFITENGMGKSYADFYSQPFKPELITKLFEGWENTRNTDTFLSFSNSTHLIYWQKNIPEIMYIEYSDEYKNMNITEYNTPRTLDDFITDCQRAGIELNWKEQSHEKQN